MSSKCCCENSCKTDNEIDKKISAIIEKYKDKEGALIPVLHEVQSVYGYLPLEIQERIAEGLNISAAEVYGVVSFYTQFSIKPKGKYSISVCMGTACYVKGAGALLDKIKEKIGIEVGECTEDGKFSIDACRCIGACGLAPVLTVNEEVYGRLVVDDIEGIIKKYQEQE